MKILITTSSFGSYDNTPLNKLKEEGFELVTNPFGRTLSMHDALKLYTADIDGVIAGTENITSEVIDSAKNLKVISRCGIGLDNVDMETAMTRKIKVFNTPEPVVDAVAELTLGLILCALRNVALNDRNIRNGIWNKAMGSLLKEKTLGIVGLGNIGKRLTELVRPFGLRVLAYDKKIDNDFAVKSGVKYTDLEALLSESDIVSLHLPLTDETKGMFNRDRISSMKPGALLINTSRAAVIDEDALVDALKHKKIKGAALDVFEKEPYNGPLTKLNNVILTPHIGSYAKEARIRMEIEAAKNLITGLTEKEQ